MFAEFRARYPNGSLTSEIIEVNQGKFIVRVAVTLEGTMLATGFGASEQLEEAEDRARLRALEAVGLFLEPADRGQAQLISSTPAYQLPAALSVVTPIAAPISTPIPAPLAAPMVDVVSDRFDDRSPDRFDGRSGMDPTLDPTLEATSPGYEDPYEVEHGASDPLPTMEPEWPPEPEPEPAPAPAPKRSRRAASPPAPTPIPVPTPAPAPAPAPTDLSDAIAQTDVLMKRLGWNKQQGVEYLQMAFGKRTRAQLTDRELLQFLQHLQTLADDPDF